MTNPTGPMLTGIEVLVVPDDDEHPMCRLRNSLEYQRRSAAALSVVGDEALALGVGRAVGTANRDTRLAPLGAPWVLVLREGDRLHPEALLRLERITDGVKGAWLELLVQPDARLSPPMDGSLAPTACSHRLLARRDWPGWSAFWERLSHTTLNEAVRALATVRPEGQRVKVSERLLAPLGEVETPAIDLRAFDALLRNPTDSVTVVAIGGIPERWPSRLSFVPTLGVERWAELGRVARAVRTRSMVCVGPALADRFDAGILTRLAVRRHGGADLVVLTALGSDPWPDWQQLDVVPDQAVPVVGLMALTTDVLEAMRHLGEGCTQLDEDDRDRAMLEAIVAVGSARGVRRCVVNGLRLALAEPAEQTPGRCTAVPNVRFVPPAGPAPRHTLSTSRPTWSPRHIIEVELVLDPARPDLPMLSSSLAPLPASPFAARVVIGGLERYPFPGSRPLCRRIAEDGVSYHGELPDAAPAGETYEVLGYAPEIPLVDMSPLVHRWAAGANELRAMFGLHLPEWPPLGINGYAVHRLPSRLGEGQAPAVAATFVIELPGRPIGARHPDTLVTARQLGLVARPGPGLADRPFLGSCAVDFVGGGRGHGRLEPIGADLGMPSAVATVWGPAPDLRRVPLVEWRCEGQQRLTVGDAPLVLRRGRLVVDAAAELVGTLGMVAPVGTGEQPLYELFHRGRGLWAYATAPEADLAYGYEVVRVVGETLRVRTARGVGLLRWHDRRSGHLTVGFVTSRPALALYGWLDLVSLAVPDDDGDRSFEWSTPLARHPVPGGMPVVRLVAAAGGEVSTAAVEPFLRRGWACASVLGFAPATVSEPEQLIAELARQASELGETEPGLPDRAQRLAQRARSTAAAMAASFGAKR